jgi:uncharacterized membrane protein YfcA
MSVLVFSGLLFVISYFAGILGAITGLGGGAVLIPVLVLVFHVNIYYAMGASLISVIATSSGATAVYLRHGLTNLRLGMLLEVGAVSGAIIGALLVKFIPASIIATILGFVLFISAFFVLKRHEDQDLLLPSHPWAQTLKLDGTYPIVGGRKAYHVQQVPLALSLMSFAGLLSGLLGIGAGVLKVVAMDQTLRLPYRVSTTTSNFMIGITATASVGIYFARGYIDPGLVFPVLVGVLLGSFTGTLMLARLHIRLLRLIFSIVICLLGLELIYKGLSGGF